MLSRNTNGSVILPQRAPPHLLQKVLRVPVTGLLMTAPLTNCGSDRCEEEEVRASLAGPPWNVLPGTTRKPLRAADVAGEVLCEVNLAGVSQRALSAFQGQAVVSCPSTSKPWGTPQPRNPLNLSSVHLLATDVSGLCGRVPEPYNLWGFYHKPPRVVWLDSQDFLIKVLI